MNFNHRSQSSKTFHLNQLVPLAGKLKYGDPIRKEKEPPRKEIKPVRPK